MREVRWERMFPDQLEAAFRECPVLYLSYGLCEPHGPQNAVGLDALKAHALCVKAAQEGGGIAAPPDYWHVHEVGTYATWARRAVGEVERKWLTAMPPWQHFKNVCYHVRAADMVGFHAVILLTGHYGPNWMDLKTLMDLLQPRVAARLYALPDFEANQPGFDRDNKSSGDHAGKVETSLLWALEPACVDVSRLPSFPLPPQAEGEPGKFFAMGHNANLSNRRTGDRMVADEVAFLTKKAAELRAAYATAPKPAAAARLNRFEDVETFWDETVRPALGAFKSYAPYLEPTDVVKALPEGSVWKANSVGPRRG